MANYSIDTHPQKALIVQKILDGMPVRHICLGLNPPLSFQTIQRYKSNIIKPIVKRANETGHVLRLKKPLVSPKDETDTRQTVQNAVMDAPVVSLFRERLEKLHNRIERSLEKAEDAVRVVRDKDTGELLPVGSDMSILSPLINQAHKNIEMLGRATGELEQAGSGGGVSIQVVCPVAPSIDAMPRINYSAPDAIEGSASEFAEIGVKPE